MYRYWLFAAECYYASGGMCDFKGAFVTVEEAIENGKSLDRKESIDWWHIFDSQDGKVVAESACKPYGFQAYPSFNGS